MNRPAIPEAAIDAAVNARGRLNNPNWDHRVFGYQAFNKDQKEHLREQARVTLEAAAPHMLVASLKAVGIDPKETLEVDVSEDGIYATVRAIDENGKRIIDPDLGAMNYAIHIPVQEHKGGN